MRANNWPRRTWSPALTRRLWGRDGLPHEPSVDVGAVGVGQQTAKAGTCDVDVAVAKQPSVGQCKLTEMSRSPAETQGVNNGSNCPRY
jgi:hypothetical protein